MINNVAKDTDTNTNRDSNRLTVGTLSLPVDCQSFLGAKANRSYFGRIKQLTADKQSIVDETRQFDRDVVRPIERWTDCQSA